MTSALLPALLLALSGQFYQVDTDGDGDPDFYQWNGTAEWRLGTQAGSSGQCLCSNGSAASPTWQAVLAKSPPAQCIHSAMRPYELEGCIAPGTVRGPEGWAPGNSSRTLKQIFDAFQGWTPQRHFVAEVIDE